MLKVGSLRESHIVKQHAYNLLALFLSASLWLPSCCDNFLSLCSRTSSRRRSLAVEVLAAEGGADGDAAAADCDAAAADCDSAVEDDAACACNAGGVAAEPTFAADESAALSAPTLALLSINEADPATLASAVGLAAVLSADEGRVAAVAAAAAAAALPAAAAAATLHSST